MLLARARRRGSSPIVGGGTNLRRTEEVAITQLSSSKLLRAISLLQQRRLKHLESGRGVEDHVDLRIAAHGKLVHNDVAQRKGLRT